MNLLRLTIVLGLLSASMLSAQDSKSLTQLLFEFPFGRPAYAPLLNEFEIAPRMDFRNAAGSTSMSMGFDAEYAISRSFLLEAGVNSIGLNDGLAKPFLDRGFDLGGFYTVSSSATFVLTVGGECVIPFEQDTDEQEVFAFDPMIVAATSIGVLQIHAGLNAEISSSSAVPGFYLAAICILGHIRPFIEFVRFSERSHTMVLSPGLVIPISSDFQCGLGLPIELGKGKTGMGVTVYCAIELGDE